MMACNRQDTQRIKLPDATLSAFYSTYSLERIEPKGLKLSGDIYSQVKNDLNLNSLEALSSGNSVICIIAFKQANKYYAIKTVKGIVKDELLYYGKMRDDRNGKIGIIKNEEALSVEFKDGARTIKSLTEHEYKIQFAGFCQRENGQSYGDCFRHECDEFCDSFVSCIALATQPQVSIVIGLACSCNAG